METAKEALKSKTMSVLEGIVDDLKNSSAQSVLKPSDDNNYIEVFPRLQLGLFNSICNILQSVDCGHPLTTKKSILLRQKTRAM